MVMRFWNPLDAAGRAALDAMITQQAQIISYIDDYKLLMIAILSVFPAADRVQENGAQRCGSHACNGVIDP